MKINSIRKAVCLVAVLAVGAIPLTTLAQQQSTNAPSQVRFRPKTTSAPSVRVTGGSRGSGDATIKLDVLAPDDVGITTKPQPSLFWFQSRPSKAKFELTLLEDNKAKPLLQVTVDRSAGAGVQRLKMSEHDLKLTPGVEYQWVVALISDPDNRSTDQVASGVIKYLEPDEELRSKVSKSAPQNLAGVYAEAGIWYDALAVLSDQIDAEPQNKAVRQARADLLRQVGLKEAAGAESTLAQK